MQTTEAKLKMLVDGIVQYAEQKRLDPTLKQLGTLAGEIRDAGVHLARTKADMLAETVIELSAMIEVPNTAGVRAVRGKVEDMRRRRDGLAEREQETKTRP